MLFYDFNLKGEKMEYKKLFLPIGGGDELKERIYGALLVAKHFNTYIEIFAAIPNINQKSSMLLPTHVARELDIVMKSKYEEENDRIYTVLEDVAKEVGIELCKEPKPNTPSANLVFKHGDRSKLVADESKFCDLVIAASPPEGVATATFEAAILHSGKAVLVIPRVMKKFDTTSCIIGWNGSQEVARAVTSSVQVLKNAQRVTIVSSKEYMQDKEKMDKLIEYLSLHDIHVNVEIIKTTKIPGEALLNAALDGNFDMIVAGAYGHRGLKEMFFGGATKYLLEKSNIPIFMSH